MAWLSTTFVPRSPITLDISVDGHARTRLLLELRAKVFTRALMEL